MLKNNRISRILDRCLKEFELDLSGLTIFTEAATGSYLYTPILAALAGASRVFAFTRDSRYGSCDRVLEMTMQAARDFAVEQQIVVTFEKLPEQIAQADIITNSGFVRPINQQMISCMKPTAVIPLMWEPWEFRASDMDLAYCRDKGILVLGTDESQLPHDMYPYAGYIALKLLFEMGLEGHKTRILLLGSRPSLGASIYKLLSQIGISVVWFSDADNGANPYSDLREHFMEYGGQYDALIVAEHHDPRCLIGSCGILTPEIISAVNPALQIGVISGNVEADILRLNNIYLFPQIIQPFGVMSYQASDLGPLPVLDLYAVGLKVGQVMAQSRLAGLTVQQAALYTLTHAPALDFEGDYKWI